MFAARIFCAALVCAAPVFAPPALIATVAAAAEVTTPSGLRIDDTLEGKGAPAQPGQTVTVHYTGWLYVDGKKGAKFDSSRDRGEPFAFTLGKGDVIKGWDEGVANMRVGGKRTLIIPAALGYGASGAGGVIPPNAALIFDVELLGVK
jgi:peptidylprolyl isomerase